MVLGEEWSRAETLIQPLAPGSVMASSHWETIPEGVGEASATLGDRAEVLGTVCEDTNYASVTIAVPSAEPLRHV